jgi:hypothetical protein
VTPNGFKMPDGFKALYAFASDPSIQLWERGVKPPGMDGGEGIDTTTQHNVTWRTKAARHLKTLTEGSFTCAYDPDSYNNLLNLVNHEEAVTCHYPDGSAVAFFAFMQKFEPSELKEGEFPEATVTITPTNWDPVGFVEAGPVFVPAGGT